MAALIVTDVASGQQLDRVTLDDGGGLQFHTGSAEPLFRVLTDTGMTPEQAFDLRTAWSNGYVRTSASIDLDDLPPIPGLREQVGGSLTAAFRFDPGQRRDEGGRWTDGGGPDLDEDDEEETGVEDVHRNVERFPSRYLRRYGHVVDEVEIGEDDLFVAKTDKGAFHVARGENDRRVLLELDDDKAGSLADFLLLFSENQPDFHVTDPLSGATLRSRGDGGVRVEWPDGPASDLSEDGVAFLQEALRVLGPGFADED
jgi:hypothetical protein